MTTPDAYELVRTPPAQRAIANELPEAVAAAVIELLTTVLVANPHRVGKQLRGVVLRVEHRRDAYRPF